jgi:DivIVA domain-containing protein
MPNRHRPGRKSRVLTSDEVVLATFRTTKWREGYDQVEVDDFLDRVVLSMRAIETAIADLQDQAASDAARIAQLQQVVAAYQARGIALGSPPLPPPSPLACQPPAAFNP